MPPDICNPQDSEGSFILTVEQSQSVFGVTNLAVRTPVTVLEIGSDGQYAAIAESVFGASYSVFGSRRESWLFRED